MERTRLITAVLIVNSLLALVALGWLAWISVAPRYWFSGAYAAQGPQGEQGPRGEQGAVGPAGPVGPDAEDAIAGLEAEVSDLSDRVDTLESDLSSLQDESGGSTLEDDVQTATGTVTGLCDALSLTDGTLYDIYVSAC
jgi:hypothetical protein